MLTSGLNLIFNAFKFREQDGKPLSLREAETVSRVIGNLDKIVRLDAGDPTDIVEVAKAVPSTFKDIVKALERDPFIDITMLKKGIDYDVKPDTIQSGATGGTQKESDTGGKDSAT